MAPTRALTFLKEQGLSDEDVEEILRKAEANYREGFPERMKEYEEEQNKRAKAQQWTKASDDFEYTI